MKNKLDETIKEIYNFKKPFWVFVLGMYIFGVYINDYFIMSATVFLTIAYLIWLPILLTLIAINNNLRELVKR